jgi:hypothetical protein
MKSNKKNKSDEKKVRFRANLLASSNGNIVWIISMTVLSFVLSVSLSYISSSILKDVSIMVAFVVVFAIVLLNIISDTIGTAVTAAEEKPFHGMASRKLYAAEQSIKLIRNADRVSNFCNDVVGDICGIISGAASAYIAIKILKTSINVETSITSLVITACVAGLTVGGKAIGKTIAIKNSNYIVYNVSVVVKFFTGNIGFKRNEKNNDKN